MHKFIIQVSYKNYAISKEDFYNLIEIIQRAKQVTKVIGEEYCEVDAKQTPILKEFMYLEVREKEGALSPELSADLDALAVEYSAPSSVFGGELP